MGLVKRTYVDGETVITADNLNDIQDAIIQNEEDITTKGTYSKPTGGIPKTDLATSVQDTLDEVADLEDEVIISDTQPTEPNNKLWVKESSSSDGISIPTMDDIDDIEDDIGTIQNTLNQIETALTPVNVSTGINGLYAKKTGRIVVLYAYDFRPSVWNASIGALPSSLKPARTSYAPMISSDGSILRAMMVSSTDGTVRMNGEATTSYFYGTFSYTT